MLYAILVEGQGPLGSVFSRRRFHRPRGPRHRRRRAPRIRRRLGRAAPVLPLADPLPLRLAEGLTPRPPTRRALYGRHRTPRAESARPEPAARRPGLVVELRTSARTRRDPPRSAAGRWSFRPFSISGGTARQRRPCVAAVRSGIAGRPTLPAPGLFHEVPHRLVRPRPRAGDRPWQLPFDRSRSTHARRPADRESGRTGHSQPHRCPLLGLTDPAKRRSRRSCKRRGWTTSPTTASCPPGEAPSNEGLWMRRPKGFTLVELLVVILIIGLVSAATLPTILPALAHRQVSESARILQAAIEGARDAAIRANAPRGIRLMPDPTFPGSTTRRTSRWPSTGSSRSSRPANTPRAGSRSGRRHPGPSPPRIRRPPACIPGGAAHRGGRSSTAGRSC